MLDVYGSGGLPVNRILLSAAFIGIAVSSVIAQPAAKPANPELADYKAADQALTTKIEPSSAGAVGASGYLGVTIARDKSGKPVVDSIQPKSPADLAGIKLGDTVVRVNDRPVTTLDSFREWVQAGIPGNAIKIELLR